MMKQKTMIFTILISAFFILNLSPAPAGEFPKEIMNEYRTGEKKVEETENPALSDPQVKRVKYRFGGEEVTGMAVYPKDASGNYPGVLFLKLQDESVEEQIQKLKPLADNGYVIFTAPWSNHITAEEALSQLIKLERVDFKKIAVMGVHEGATEALFQAIRQRGKVSAVISVAGHPPYDMPGGEPAEVLEVPALMVHGDMDSQVPISVSQYFYYNLRDLGKKAEIFIMPNSRHYFNDAEWDQVMVRVAEFLETRVKNPVPDEEEDDGSF